MINPFKKVMAGHSDNQLKQVLKERHNYQELAVDAAVNEAIKRSLLKDRKDLEEKFPISKESTISFKDAVIELRESDEDIEERAKKNRLYGAIWCIGGVLATLADVGYIFWGAIVFGGIQFFRGVLRT